MQLALFAVSLVDLSVGIKMPARMTITAMTTSNSIKVKLFFIFFLLDPEVLLLRFAGESYPVPAKTSQDTRIVFV